MMINIHETALTARVLGIVAAIYNGLLGAAFLFASVPFQWRGVRPPNHRGYVHFPAALHQLAMLCLLAIPMAAHGDDYFELRNGLANSRLVFEQTHKGRVVFLGGSITNMTGWKELVATDLQQRFPTTQFDFINAGVPSTGSTPGAFRLQRDAFNNGQVDLLFEEAAVNDYYNGRSNQEQMHAMEGIVRVARLPDVSMQHGPANS